ncbi:D-2-hydroxyacid dehydrogenase [Paenibacillus sp. PSB04]|uniref:D-2-hydroxyacid dehydrogenase n=1 Tax=Paenibacillus sp. PSB04 TaxID=2866810 RepID=UPI0021F20D65|nr:D-2-hydroxyacid dehydrogenase [Paenibacillus sp. PSB04]UYO04886.1 D-2-hydroxyacid dehydrogenase [Paenibacillus sp. PSB04]
MKQIVCLHSLTPEQTQLIEQAAPGYKLTVVKSTDADPALVNEAEILVGWSRQIADQVLNQDSRLKWLQTWSAGVDTLPLDKLEQKGVLLTNSSGVHAIPISETILGMMLSFSRQLHVSVRNQLKHSWETKLAAPGRDTLSELHGRTAVIVGVGEIGSETARLAKAFGMRTVGVRRSGKADPHVDEMFTMDGLHKALSQGDYIISVLPLTDETHHLLNAAAWAAAKPGACFINAGRGPTVDTASLLGALRSGQISCAGLDVFEKEPLPEDHPLWDMEQVIITPHVSGSTDRYTERVIDIFVENLKAYVQGKELPRNLVNYERAY